MKGTWDHRKKLWRQNGGSDRGDKEKWQGRKVVVDMNGKEWLVGWGGQVGRLKNLKDFGKLQGMKVQEGIRVAVF